VGCGRRSLGTGTGNNNGAGVCPVIRAARVVVSDTRDLFAERCLTRCGTRPRCHGGLGMAVLYRDSVST
jgi:hypothetical protein